MRQNLQRHTHAIFLLLVLTWPILYRLVVIYIGPLALEHLLRLEIFWSETITGPSTVFLFQYYYRYYKLGTDIERKVSGTITRSSYVTGLSFNYSVNNLRVTAVHITRSSFRFLRRLLASDVQP